MKKKIYLMAAVVAAMISGCAKDGATGPQGPAGPAGTNGSANVSSGIVTVTPGTWSANGSGFWDVSYSDADISNADQDVVIAYVQIPSLPDNWWSIPTRNLLSANDAFDVIYSNGSFTIEYTNPTAPVVTVEFKVVVVPPAIVIHNPNVNWRDYNQVSKFLSVNNSKLK